MNHNEAIGTVSFAFGGGKSWNVTVYQNTMTQRLAPRLDQKSVREYFGILHADFDEHAPVAHHDINIYEHVTEMSCGKYRITIIRQMVNNKPTYKIHGR